MPNVQTRARKGVKYTNGGKPALLEKFNPNCRATQTTPRWDLLEKDSNEPLAIDIEFQEYRPKDQEKWGHRIGRVALVNTRGETVYDTYCRYGFNKDVRVKLPPRIFGVTYDDLRIENGAKWISEVEKNLKAIMKGRVIIGHDLRLDILAINEKVWKTVPSTVDTQNMYGRVKLCYLAADYCDISIQNGDHDPSEDAKATMLLYLRSRPYKGRSDFTEKLELGLDDFPTLAAAHNKT